MGGWPRPHRASPVDFRREGLADTAEAVKWYSRPFSANGRSAVKVPRPCPPTPAWAIGHEYTQAPTSRYGTRPPAPGCNVMNDRPDRLEKSRSSRERYRGFVQDYRQRRLDDAADAAKGEGQRDGAAKPDEDAPAPKPQRPGRGKRREYLREYLRWLRPHRYAVGTVFVLALLVAGLQMIEPLFMRFIIDRVLLDTALDTASRLARLHLAGAVFLGA